MRWPKLVRNAKTPVRVVVETAETNAFGEKAVILDKNLMCNYQDAASQKNTTEKRETVISGSVLIDGDILASLGVDKIDFGVDEEGYLVLTSVKIDENGILSYCDEIEPDTDIIASGYVVIFGRRRNIVKGQKARNPDGSVNYTRLDVS